MALRRWPTGCCQGWRKAASSRARRAPPTSTSLPRRERTTRSSSSGSARPASCVSTVASGSVPLALSGSLLFSFLGLTSINIYSQVGLITLVGLVSRNGILIVQFANELQEAGRDKLSAVIEASGTRLRPILMTTAATVMGHLPLVFARGPGAGARNSIGIMLVTGMIIGTAFTLFVVPSIYVLLARKRTRTSPVEEPEAAGELEPATT